MGEWSGTRETSGFTKLGDVAPAIKLKKLTGTTGATEGDTTTIVHGLTLAKIIGMNVLVTATNGNLIPPSFVRVFEFQYDVFIDPTVVRVILSIANSGSILTSAITVLLTYEA